MENLTLVKSTLKPAWQKPCPSGSGSSKKHTRTASIRWDNTQMQAGSITALTVKIQKQGSVFLFKIHQSVREHAKCMQGVEIVPNFGGTQGEA